MNRRARPKKDTSWQPVSKWYDKLVGQTGQEYHERLIIPALLQVADFQTGDSVLDVGCGQGVLARSIPQEIEYFGIDVSSSLIASAKKRDHNPAHTYQVQNAIKPLKINRQFTHVIFVLSLQNMKDANRAIQHATQKLSPNGKVILVLNHPCFRIPRQSSWGVDESKKTQYRRVDRYRTPLEIPITAHPGRPGSEVTWSYHYSLDDLSTFIYQSKCVIEQIKELYSGKVSEGKSAKMENRARNEFPLFLMIAGRKSK